MQNILDLINQGKQMNIKQVRNKLELSNHQLAHKLGVSVKSVEAYISGKRAIDRAGIAVKRNWKQLVKKASEAGK